MAVVPPGVLPTPNSKYSPPCDSRFAEGCIRGFYVGGLWGAFFHRYDLKPPPPVEGKEMVVREGPTFSQMARIRASGALKHSLLMATFLGLYSGSSCAAEKTIGRRNWATSFIGGFTAGTFAGITTGNPHHALTWGMGTGVASMLVFALQGQG